MSQGLSLEQMEQVHHVAQLAVLALCARGVAAAEFDANSEVQEVRVVVHRPVLTEQPAVDVEFVGNHAVPLGGMSL